ncbi:Prokineticin receptor 2 [Holothuria leucospilota]|uniref:Prokineticin receptor 2 n=1 Tax=Holothuria leucospilota TaxID=206669 RepID=A0A9Q1H1K1_HOLLE|nr:Prokineticin receptor 2 [Holothuria leucospilota]
MSPFNYNSSLYSFWGDEGSLQSSYALNIDDEYLSVPLAAKIFLILSFALTFVVCGIGDTFLCMLIIRHQRLRSVTNLLIANLAVSDVIVAIICVPIKLVYYIRMQWIGGKTLCRLVGTLQVASLFVSVNTLLVIAIDRYIGIFWPLRPRLKKTTLVVIIIGIWLFSFLVALPTPINIEMNSGIGENGHVVSICQEHWYDRTLGRMYISFITFSEFLVPCFLMGFIYFSIAQRLWFHRTLPGNQTDQNREISLIRKRKTIPTLITVVVAFFLCWAPYYGYNLALQFRHDNFEEMGSLLTVYFVVESVAMLNSVISTIIYLFMSPIFRAELVNLWKPLMYGQRFERRLKYESQRGRYHIPSRTGSNISHTKNGSLNVVRKSSHETGEARL